MNANELGRPIYWSLEHHMKAIIQMICADEIQIALSMCDQVPAWYRENPPKELQEIKKTLYRQLYDVLEYSADAEEFDRSIEESVSQWTNGFMFPRGEIISDIVRAYNAEGVTPWIFDLGCSSGNLPINLKRLGHKFTYLGKSLNHGLADKLKAHLGAEVWSDKPLDNQPTMLVCTEVLEHCMRPEDLVQSAYKLCVDFDRIVFSTPLGCLAGGLPDWNTRRLGHVRSWTKNEFTDFMQKHWPGYVWELTLSASMVLSGKRI